MDKFKVGETVLRTGKDSLYAKQGRVYVVERVVEGKYVALEGVPCVFHLIHFAKLERETPANHHRHHDCIVAWAKGKVIQFHVSNSGSWTDINPDHAPAWNSLGSSFRVKPDKTAKELMIEDLERQAQQLADDIKKLREGEGEGL